MHNDAAAAQKEVSRPPSKLSLNRGGSGKPPASPQRPPSLSGHTASPASGRSSSAQVPLASSSSSGPQFKGAATSSTISFTRVGSTAARASTSAKATNWTEDVTLPPSKILHWRVILHQFKTHSRKRFLIPPSRCKRKRAAHKVHWRRSLT
jgi:hypothetical protein